jgi:hypothetical protein
MTWKGENEGEEQGTVEYVKWLEEGRDALLDEVLRTEAAAGIPHH